MNVRRLLVLSGLAALLVLAVVARLEYVGRLTEAFEAFEHGEYVRASQLLTPLAYMGSGLARSIVIRAEWLQGTEASKSNARAWLERSEPEEASTELYYLARDLCETYDRDDECLLLMHEAASRGNTMAKGFLEARRAS